MTSMATTVAIVGGGVSGCAAACYIAEAAKADHVDVTVELFDQGSRGPGGRASHRRVREEDGEVLDDNSRTAEADAFEFDHGCQFFRADSERFKAIVQELVAAEVVHEWEGRFGCLPSSDGEVGVDFFGACSGDALFVGVGGMHRVARHLAARAERAGAKVNRGTRVAAVLPQTREVVTKRWRLEGTSGKAALHDTNEILASQAVHRHLTDADIVIVSDASCSFDAWHRASAGIAQVAPDLAAAVRSRARIPLFTAMVAFNGPTGAALDGIVFDSEVLWFAARSSDSKSSDHLPRGALERECWTLISTPAFAADEIGSVEMQDPETGAFRPQENDYLNAEGGPADALVQEFRKALMHGGAEAEMHSFPEVVFLQGQRWGSAMPALETALLSKSQDGRCYTTPTPDSHSHPSRKVIMDVLYETKTPDLSRKAAEKAKEQRVSGQEGLLDFFVDRGLGVYYVGDFCSTRVPGVEAAVLSAQDAAADILSGMRVSTEKSVHITRRSLL